MYMVTSISIDERNQLVMANIKLVHMVAKQFGGNSHRYEDLLQEGFMGLMRATETFEPERNLKFSTYGVYWVRAKMHRLLQNLEPLSESAETIDTLVSEIDTPETQILKREICTGINQVLGEIVLELNDPRLKEIIRWRLLADEPTTLEALGKRLNLSREGTRLLELKMLKLAKERLAFWHAD